MEYTVTIQVEADSPSEVKARFAGMGLTPTRVTAKREPGVITQLDPKHRPDALTDMPAGLTVEERKAYVRGYARGAMAYTKKHGGPRGDTWEAVHASTLAYMQARHAACHTAGMKMLNIWRERWSEYRQAVAAAAAATAA